MAVTVAVLVVAACSDDSASRPAPDDPLTDTTSLTNDADPTVAEATVPPTTADTTTAPAPTTTMAPSPIDTVAASDSVLVSIQSRSDLTRFAQLADALGSDAVFQQARGVTVLAPNDVAWSTYDDAAWAALLDDRDAVALLISEHLSIGAASLADLIERGAFQNAMARALPVVDGEGTRIGGALVLAADLTADNGVVHVIDSVLVASDTPSP